MSADLVLLGRLLMALATTIGPVAVLLMLRNGRDRRELELLGDVMSALNSKDLRERIAVGVRCALLLRRGVVTVDMRACTGEEIWDAVWRVSSRLPPSVRLEVDGTVDPQLAATLTVQPARKLPWRLTPHYVATGWTASEYRTRGG